MITNPYFLIQNHCNLFQAVNYVRSNIKSYKEQGINSLGCKDCRDEKKYILLIVVLFEGLSFLSKKKSI